MLRQVADVNPGNQVHWANHQIVNQISNANHNSVHVERFYDGTKFQQTP